MKRQLDSKYKNLVDYVNKRKDDKEITEILVKLSKDDNYDFGKILRSLSVDDHYWQMRDRLVPIIVDIYNDNYELIKPSYYWKLNMPFMDNCITAYVGQIGQAGHVELVTSEDVFTATEFTKQELIDVLNYSDTNLTIDNFTPMEAIE